MMPVGTVFGLEVAGMDDLLEALAVSLIRRRSSRTLLGRVRHPLAQPRAPEGPYSGWAEGAGRLGRGAALQGQSCPSRSGWESSPPTGPRVGHRVGSRLVRLVSGGGCEPRPGHPLLGTPATAAQVCGRSPRAGTEVGRGETRTRDRQPRTGGTTWAHESRALGAALPAETCSGPEPCESGEPQIDTCAPKAPRASLRVTTQGGDLGPCTAASRGPAPSGPARRGPARRGPRRAAAPLHRTGFLYPVPRCPPPLLYVASLPYRRVRMGFWLRNCRNPPFMKLRKIRLLMPGITEDFQKEKQECFLI